MYTQPLSLKSTDSREVGASLPGTGMDEPIIPVVLPFGWPPGWESEGTTGSEAESRAGLDRTPAGVRDIRVGYEATIRASPEGERE